MTPTNDFTPDGHSWRFDSVHLARALAAITGFTGHSPFQIEIHRDGAIIVGTDTYNLIRTFVPLAGGDGHADTADQWAGSPPPDTTPDHVYTVIDRGRGPLKAWISFYANAKRAKDNPVEHVTVRSGTIPSTTPTLGDQVIRQGLLLAGDLSAVRLDDTGQHTDWRKLVDRLDKAKPIAQPARFVGSTLAAAGNLGKYDPDRQVIFQTVVTDDGFEALTISSPGSFPYIEGFCAAAKPR